MKPRPPRGMAFDRIPTREIAEILRIWAKAFIDDLIFRGASDVRREAGTDVVHGLKPLLVSWRFPRRARRRFTRNLSKTFVGFRHEVAQNPVLLSAGEREARERFFGPIANRFALGGGRIPPVWVPDGLWDLAAAEAWEDAAFKQWITDEVYQELRTTFLWPKGEVPVAVVDRRVFWLLLDIFEISEWSDRPEWERWVPFAGRGARKLASDLRQVARKRWLQPGWCGFWEQWLILQAAGRLGPDDLRRERNSFRLIRSLPVFRSEAAAGIAPRVGWLKPKRGAIALQDSNWYRRIPAILRDDYKLRQLDGIEEAYVDPPSIWEIVKMRVSAAWRTVISPRRWWSAIKRGATGLWEALKKPLETWGVIREKIVESWLWIAERGERLWQRLQRRRRVRGALKGRGPANAGAPKT